MTDAEMTRQLDYILTCLKNMPFEEDEEEEAIKSGSSLDLIVIRQTTHSSDDALRRPPSDKNCRKETITEVTEGRDSTPTNAGAHTTR